MFMDTELGAKNTILETEEPPEEIGIVRKNRIEYEEALLQLMEHESDPDKHFGKVERKNLPNSVEVDGPLDLSASLRSPVEPLMDTLEVEEGVHQQPTHGTILSGVRHTVRTREEFEPTRIKGDFEQSGSSIMRILAKRAPYFHGLLLYHTDLTFLCTNMPFSYPRTSSILPFRPVDGVSVFVPNKEVLLGYLNLTIEQIKWILLYHFVRQRIDIRAFNSSGQFTFETLLSRAALLLSTEHPQQDGEPQVLMDVPQRIIVDIAPMHGGRNLMAQMSIKLDGHSARLTHPPIVCSNGVIFFVDSVLTIPQSLPQSISVSHSICTQFELISDTVRMLNHPGVTVFAISNPVWDTFVRSLSSSVPISRMIQHIYYTSLYHALPQPIYHDSFKPDLEVSSCLPGGRVRFKYDAQGRHQWSVNGCTILELVLFDGGVIYCIDGMMQLDDGKQNEPSPRGNSMASNASGTLTTTSESNNNQPSPRGLQARIRGMSIEDAGVRNVRRRMIICDCCHCIIL